MSNLGSATISGFEANPEGSLSRLPGSPYTSGIAPDAMAVHPRGKLLYAVMTQQPPGVRGANCFDISEAELFTYTINAAGRLALANKKILQGFCGADVLVDPTGKFLYVSMLTQDGSAGKLAGFSIDAASGALTEIPGSPFSSPPLSGMDMHPTGKFVYAAPNGGEAGVKIYDRDMTSGILSFRETAPSAVGVDLAVTPSGKFLLTQDAEPAITISVFAIDGTTGKLTLASSAVSPRPMSVDVDLGGKFVAAGNGNQGVSVFTMDGNSGALSPVAGSPFDAGSSAFNAEFDATGKVLFVPQFQKSSLRTFRIDPSTGVLTVIGTFKTGNFPGDVTTLLK